MDIEAFYNYIQRSKTEKKQNVFQLPYHLKEASIEHVAWQKGASPEQIIFDLRTQSEKENVRRNINISTFKH